MIQQQATQMKYWGLLIGVWIRRAPVRMHRISELFSPLWNPAEFLIELHSTFHMKQSHHRLVRLLVRVWDETRPRWDRFWMSPAPTLARQFYSLLLFVPPWSTGAPDCLWKEWFVHAAEEALPTEPLSAPSSFTELRWRENSDSSDSPDMNIYTWLCAAGLSRLSHRLYFSVLLCV